MMRNKFVDHQFENSDDQATCTYGTVKYQVFFVNIAYLGEMKITEELQLQTRMLKQILLPLLLNEGILPGKRFRAKNFVIFCWYVEL